MRTKEDVVEEFRRHSICDAAMRVVARKGVQSATVQDIATEAGVAKGTIYLYFSSRDAILDKAIEDAAETLIAKLAAVSQSYTTFRDILEKRVRTHLQHFDGEHRDFFRMYLAIAEPYGQRRLRPHRMYVAYVAQVEALLREAIARGEIRPLPVERFAGSVTAIIREIVRSRIMEKNPPPVEDDVAYVVDVVMRGIGGFER